MKKNGTDFYSEMRDDEIRIIGGDGGGKNEPRRSRAGLWTIVVVVAVGIVAASLFLTGKGEEGEGNGEEQEPSYFEPADSIATTKDSVAIAPIGSASASDGYCEIIDTIINDVPLKLYIPHNAEMTLHVGKVDKKDTSIIFTAQAADVRADNGDIVGAFVLKGEPLSRGLSKKGFCASIDGRVSIGVADNSPLYEEAVEKGGYFFRQYPLVGNGKVVENELKGKSIRRGICDRNGEIFMVESQSIESFHDFSQALADMQVDNAIYIVGSSAYGWAVDKDSIRHEFGKTNMRGLPPSTSYIIWRKR